MIESGSNIVAITVGDGVKKKDVESLATNKKAVFEVTSSDEGVMNISDVTQAFKELLEHAKLLPKFTWCHEASMNIFIVIDVRLDHPTILKALDKFVGTYNELYSNLKIEMIYSREEHDKFVTEMQSSQSEYRQVQSKVIQFSDSLSEGIRSVQRYHFAVHSPNRPPKLNIILIVVDSFHNDTESVIEAAKEVQKKGTHIMVLGIGSEVTSGNLSKIVSDQRGMLMMAPGQDLGNGLAKLYFNLCGESCHYGWRQHGEMCYRHFTNDVTWEAASDLCQKYDSKLVSVTDRQTYAWLRSEFIAPKNSSVSIGLRKRVLDSAPISSDIRWTNGKPLIFSDWSGSTTPAEPNGGMHEACVAIYPGGWRDVVCDTMLGSGLICERDTFDKTPTIPRAIEIRPLWKETPCQAPLYYEYGPLLFTNHSYCTPTYTTHIREPAMRDIYRCSNGELVPNSVLCDGKHDCQDATDEDGCHVGCSSHQFQCSNGMCVAMAYVCDSWPDCADNSDEINCLFQRPEHNSYTHWWCNSGQVIKYIQTCDLHYDCLDRSDERSCTGSCGGNKFKCRDGTCIPGHWRNDGVVDCNGGGYEDELDDQIHDPLCFSGDYDMLHYIYLRSDYYDQRMSCVIMYDKFGKHFSNWNTSTEMCDEDNLICPTGFVRCPSSFCMPIERVCNGVMDCVDGEDELHCENYVCPGYFRCPGTTFCHHPSRICDGEMDCPGGKDEVSCDFDCPVGCTCAAGVVECKYIVINKISPVYPSARKVIITDSHVMDSGVIFSGRRQVREISLISSGLTDITGMFNDQINLIKLNLSHNEISILSPNHFSNQKLLKILDVSHNPITNIEKFTGVDSLEELYVRYTMVESIQDGTFSGLGSLRLLDLTGGSLQIAEDKSFIGLVSLSVLYLQGNPVWNFGRRTFEGLDHLKELHTDVFSLCCPQVRPKFLSDDQCVSPQSSISSCNDLLSSDILRSSIWILCIASLVGNVISIMMRIVWERQSMRNGFGVFVTHLCIADFLMGVYLLFIAAADASFTGTYIWHDFEWRNSAYCSIAGALSTLSSEASAFFIVLITLDRFIVIRFPYSQKHFRYKSASVSAAIAWVLATVISIVPLFPSLSHWDFYTQNGACLALPFSTERKPGWVYSVVVFIGVNFTAFLTIALGQLSIYRAMKNNSMVSTKERRAQDMAVARRLLLIVTTDFLCWFPIGIMSILALRGVSIGGEVFAWTAVFILPVNSALNPFLYTIPAVLKRRALNRQKKEKGTSSESVQVSDVQGLVKFAEPSSEDVPLEDVLMRMSSREEKMMLMRHIWTAILEPLSNLNRDNPQQCTIYVNLKEKLPKRITLVRRDDKGNCGLSYLLHLINRQNF